MHLAFGVQRKTAWGFAADWPLETLDGSFAGDLLAELGSIRRD